MNNRSKLLLFISFLCLINFSTLHADEGMWLPNLLKVLKEKEMKAFGMKVSADDIYSVNKSSMKDAVVLFGRGCTGELISNEGLLLTNHHCGFGQIQKHSSLESDYLKNGFWAMKKSEELHNPGLTVTFIISIADVTKELLKDVTDDMDEMQRELKVKTNSLDVVAKAKEGTHYEAIIKPMYNGNEYYLFVTETFSDVRLVGAPPMSVGNFGRDSDNWSWPRHTADFSMFRIYAGPDNKPAEYSTKNVPYKPRHFFPISLKGVEENDFTMVYGFPARTNEYLSSYAVEQIINLSNPLKIELRKMRLDIFNEYMNKDRDIFIKYADKYASVSNYHKKWAGESKGLLNADALRKKREYEAKFTEKVNQTVSLSKYGSLLMDLQERYNRLAVFQPEMDLLNEGVLSIELLKFANGFRSLSGALQADEVEKKISSARAFYKDYIPEIDQKVATALLKEYYSTSTLAASSEFDGRLMMNAPEQFTESFVYDLFITSVLLDSTRFIQMLRQNDTLANAIIKNDIAVKTVSHFIDGYTSNISPEVSKINNDLVTLNRLYMQAQREVFTDKTFYPDANQSLRVSFGKAEGYEPLDGVKYKYYTTTKGIFQKNGTEHPDYVFETDLLELFEKKDFGQYADKNGKLRTCFIASNHTTGGNSGSPVLNAEGHLIGTNFDRNWEGTMSDIFYDINQVRNITLDIRYTLFIVDKYAGAGYLLNEMKIIK